MRFELKREGPAEACGKTCRTWIAATGSITTDTPKDFEKFAERQNVHGATIALDSGGGSVVAALTLGRMLRGYDVTTTVGKSIDLAPDKNGDKRAKLSGNADCESMCAFVLLGGTRRYVPPEAQVLVHQIWLGDRRDDATAASYTAEDLMLVQRDIGRLARYTIEMGGDIELLETTLRIPPWERLRTLTQEELRRTHVQNVDKLFDEVSVDATATAAPAAPASVITLANIAERAWGIVESSGTRLLARRHPLTVEGDEIGNFDLMFACGDKPDGYVVTYVERRKRPGVTLAFEPLKEVAVWTGKQLAVLNIMSSEVGSHPSELDTVARGVVPATLVQAFADRGRSITVATRTISDAETAIRVGNTGVSTNFAQLIAGCKK